MRKSSWKLLVEEGKFHNSERIPNKEPNNIDVFGNLIGYGFINKFIFFLTWDLNYYTTI